MYFDNIIHERYEREGERKKRPPLCLGFLLPLTDYSGGMGVRGGGGRDTTGRALLRSVALLRSPICRNVTRGEHLMYTCQRIN